MLPRPGSLSTQQFAAHQPDERRGDGQAEARAAEAARRRAVGLAEGFEDRRLLVGGDADAGVRDDEMQPRLPPSVAVHGDADDHVAALGELDGVADEIDEDLAEADGVADKAGAAHPARCRSMSSRPF